MVETELCYFSWRFFNEGALSIIIDIKTYAIWDNMMIQFFNLSALVHNRLLPCLTFQKNDKTFHLVGLTPYYRRQSTARTVHPHRVLIFGSCRAETFTPGSESVCINGLHERLCTFVAASLCRYNIGITTFERTFVICMKLEQQS